VEVAVKTQRVADIAVGCLVAALGIFVLISSTSISVAGVHRLSPRTFPYVVSILLAVCGAGLALKSWSVRETDFAIAWPDAEGVRTIVVSLAILAGYIALLNWLGLPLATFLYVTLAIWHLNRAKWMTATVIGLITGVISYVVFIQLLGLSFPAGFFLE
jgi:putative tricarboxylic transport membrane protein